MLFFSAPQNTLTGFKKFKTMLLSSSTSLPNPIMSLLFSILYTGSQLKKGSILNLLHFALNLWLVLPLPTSRTFFIFRLLLGRSIPLQTSECSIYHPFAHSQVVSALSLTKLQQHGEKKNPPLSITHLPPVPSNLPWKPFSFRKLFLQSPCPEVPLCVKVCVCVLVCVCVCVNFWHPNICIS